MIDCTLVTCATVPALDPDDRILLDELRKRGMSVSIAVWSDPGVDWAESRLCILRSTWDYHHRYREFIAWVERAAALTAIRNDRALLRWNAHKSYLRDLERRGVPVVPTAWVAQGSTRDVGELCDARGWRDVVIKPARGAAAHEVALVRHAVKASPDDKAHLDRLIDAHDVLVQPYFDSVASYGERALVFLGGRYSHAAAKKPFDTVLTAGDTRLARAEASAGEIAVATRALTALPNPPLYARVDLLRDGEGKARVSEVELIEPTLYLAAHEPAAAAFADVIEGELAALATGVRGHLPRMFGWCQGTFE